VLRLTTTIGITLLFAFQVVGHETAVDNVPRKNKPLKIGLGLTTGGVLGSYRWKKRDTADPPTPPIRRVPNYDFLRYVWDGAHMQVHPLEEDKHQWSEEATAKDGWYVTADYSTKPARVIVTKEPTKDSQWRFVRAPGSHRYYIKNENSLGKDTWLRLEDTGKRVSLGGSWEASIYNAVLSFGEKMDFVVNDIDEDGAK
jgi:hypothetical protein